ncbi:hypothetical protein [Streptomyces sp. S.PB5]|uniref:hypothetical protein n=1 Tax=Streptomyces sp. S.PB5 TaxID=3020844 RepID=UPI0025AF873A|nr:hypothetical protein [Streptomyces sp. S.PB5]MDN3026434.1 hypothetical protein [Streptomyces sp. S.PB5]
MTERSGAVEDSAHPPLSPLDVKILRLLAQGYSLREVEGEADTSAGVATRQVERLMTLLGARDRTDLVAKAKERGLV